MKVRHRHSPHLTLAEVGISILNLNGQLLSPLAENMPPSSGKRRKTNILYFMWTIVLFSTFQIDVVLSITDVYDTDNMAVVLQNSVLRLVIFYIIQFFKINYKLNIKLIK